MICFPIRRDFFILLFFSILFFSCSGPQPVFNERLGAAFDLPSGWVYANQDMAQLKGQPVCWLADGTRKSLQLYEQTEANEAVALSQQKLKSIFATNGREIVETDTFPNGFGLVFKTKEGKSYPVYVVNVGKKSFRLEPHPNYEAGDLSDAKAIARSLRPSIEK